MFSSTKLRLLLFVTVFSHGSESSGLSFKNVSLWDLREEKITTITSSSSLKGALPTNKPVSFIEVRQDIPVLYEDSVTNITDVEYLVFEGNNMVTIEPGAFKNLEKINIICLRRNNFTAIKENTFDSLPVSKLMLVDGLLKTIEVGSFRNLTKLKTLDLSNNRIETLEEGIFNYLPLLVLDLSGNQISFIAPQVFDDMTHLAEVFLDENKLTKYDRRWFHNAKNISNIYLAKNLIEEIPRKAFENIVNKRNQTIFLSDNKIKKIAPNAFSGLKHFDTLALSGNKITSWNERLLQDTENIEELLLFHNNIPCFDGDFDKIFKARMNHVYDNPLTQQCKQRIKAWNEKNRNASRKICATDDDC